MPRVALPADLLARVDRAITARHGAAVSVRLGRAGMVALLVEEGIQRLAEPKPVEEHRAG